jgi:outer membrane protein assembly factor BamB
MTLLRISPLIAMALAVGTLAAPASSQAHAQTAPWQSFRSGPQNAGHAALALRPVGDAAVAAATSRALVKFQTSGLIWGTAVIGADGTVFVGSADKHFYAINPDGSLKWSYRIFDRADSLIDSAAVLTPSGKVVVPGGDGFLHALDQKTGELQWTFKAYHVSDDAHSAGASVNSFEGNVQVGPDGTIYAGCDNGHLYALDDSGKEKWNFTTKMMIWSTPAFAPDNSWLAFGSLDSNVYLLDPKSGAELARFKAGGDVKSSVTLGPDGRLYVGSSDQKVYALEIQKSDGGARLVKKWTYQTKGEVYASPTIFGDVLVIGSLDGTVYGLGLDGALRWKYEANSPVAASAAMSSDGVALFGAKNGKMYALDATTGERLWSYKATDGLLKSNLDASPAVSATGTIWVGSYGGTVYGIPYEHCLVNRDDGRCAFGGTEDLPDFGGAVGAHTATLRFEARDGGMHLSPEAPLAHGQMLRLKLVVLENGDYLQDAAVSPTALKVTLTPNNAPIESIISSDGRYLDVLPTGLFAPDTEYTIIVDGWYFISTGWLTDRLRLGDRAKFSAKVTFRTAPAAADGLAARLTAGGTAEFGVGSMYLYQPQALETYIPAALDGQAFIMTVFGFDPAAGRMLMLGLPAFPRSGAGGLDGASPMPEPSKVFVLEGDHAGGALKGTGKFAIAAMGGEMSFDRVSFSARVDGEGRLSDGEFLAMASCLTIGSGGTSYRFPMNLIHTICDPWMRMIGVGRFEEISVAKQTVAEGAVKLVSLTKAASGRALEVELALTDAATAGSDARLVSVVQYDAASASLTEVKATTLPAAAVVGGVATVEVPAKRFQDAGHQGDVIAVFYDRVLVATVPVKEVQ